MLPDLQLLGTVHIIWCLEDSLDSWLTSSSPLLAAMRPPREASTRSVDMYIASVRDRLRSTLQEAQAQSTAEACQQKWHYDRKIGVVNLKPGDLVLVKVDTWKGKRKIKDRWEEETWEVVHQIAADIPSYKVINQHGWSWVLHWNQLLLVMSEVGVPLCMGNCHTWDRCTSPPHVRLPPWEVMIRGHHKSKMARQSPNDLPVKLPWGRKQEVVAWIIDIYQSIHWRWVKTTGKVIWLWTSEGTHT